MYLKRKAGIYVLPILTLIIALAFMAAFAMKADAASNCTFTLSSAVKDNLDVGSDVTVDINLDTADSISNDNGIAAFGLEISYDPAVLEFKSGTPGDAEGLKASDLEAPYIVKANNNPAGKVIISYSTTGIGITKSGKVYSLVFTVKGNAAGNSTIIRAALRTSPPGTVTDYNLNEIKGTAFLPGDGLNLGIKAPSVPIPVPVTAPKIVGVTASNGRLSVTLDKDPESIPAADDFTAKASVNGSSASVISLKEFNWNTSTHTAVFTFTPVAQSSNDQAISVSAAYKAGDYVAAAAFTVSALHVDTPVQNPPSSESTTTNEGITVNTGGNLEPSSNSTPLPAVNSNAGNNVQEAAPKNETCTFTLSTALKGNAAAGGEAAVDINIKTPPSITANNGIVAFGLEISYDPAVLVFKSGAAVDEAGTVLSDFEAPRVEKNSNGEPAGKLILSYYSSGTGITGSGKIYSLIFSVVDKPVGNSVVITAKLRSNPPGTVTNFNLREIKNTEFLPTDGLKVGIELPPPAAENDAVSDNQDAASKEADVPAVQNDSDNGNNKSVSGDIKPSSPSKKLAAKTAADNGLIIKTLVIKNGSASIIFNKRPSSTPRLNDFTVKAAINRVNMKNFRIKGFSWNSKTNTAVFKFDQVAQKAYDQNVTMTIIYKKKITSAAKMFKVLARKKPPLSSVNKKHK